MELLTSNKVVDWLLNREEVKEMQTMSWSYIQYHWLVDWGVQEDKTLRKTLDDFQKDPNSHFRYTNEQGNLHYKGRMVLTASCAWIPKSLARFHIIPIFEHISL